MEIPWEREEVQGLTLENCNVKKLRRCGEPTLETE